MQVPNRKTFGELLVEAGIITREQLNEAIETQKQTGKKLGEVLKQKGYITQDDIIQVLEFQLGIPHINLDRFEIEADAIKRVPENLAKRHELIPVKIDGKKIIVAMSDPLNLFAIDDIKIYTGLDVEPNIASSEDIKKAIGKFYTSQEAVKVAEQYKKDLGIEIKAVDNLEEIVNSAPIVKLVNSLYEQAIKSRASDIHIEPMERFVKIRYRIDGQLHEIMKYDIELLQAIVTRIKITGNMDIAEKRIPQDGRVSLNLDGNAYDMRLSILPTIYGEKTVIRIASKSTFIKDKSELGFYPDDLEKFNGILNNPHGIILVTGPTGSGKSTTLYAAMKDLNKEDVNIITVEDPVEAKIEGINQVQVNAKAGMTFASALRSMLRQDPDIIMVGEIRDSETANIAVSAAITGHLVLSTLHTNDSVSSISRLEDMGVEPFLLGSSVVGVLAQRLVRRICPKCAEEYVPDISELKLLKSNLEIDSVEDYKLIRGTGCTYCGHTGYRGRLGVYEILTVTNRQKELINKGASIEEIKQAALEEGFKTLKMNCIRLVLDGKTTVSEMMRVAYANE